jgi:2-polyprenyl-3-methyl-5-hydroxy-6-metoxy-1,4-benzoquinol methylase
VEIPAEEEDCATAQQMRITIAATYPAADFQLAILSAAATMLLNHIYQRLKARTINRWFPRWAYRRQKRNWQYRWAQPDFSALWMSDAIPRELERAVQTGWFEPGVEVLDIGCGEGLITAWLAQRGFKVLGVDFSASAIAKARARQTESPKNWEVKVLDVVQDHLPAARFGALFDRGCYHIIPSAFVAGYVCNVAECCRPGARFLLLHATFNHPSKPYQALREADVVRRVTGHFQPAFDIVKMESITMDTRAGEPPMPGLAFWMQRA